MSEEFKWPEDARYHPGAVWKWKNETLLLVGNFLNGKWELCNVHLDADSGTEDRPMYSVMGAMTNETLYEELSLSGEYLFNLRDLAYG